MLFMDADASKEEEGAARVVDHARAWRWQCEFGFHHHDPE
jgi:hypothetical protein